ncbi:hypothetical protein DL95DRAFT_416956 [Leptodontidium sp. 2 PMI_412]|nr:hypothetical protein DL95DRAFT_416956 [Leptodontidium sp. 2 PMI_412]
MATTSVKMIASQANSDSLQTNSDSPQATPCQRPSLNYDLPEAVKQYFQSVSPDGLPQGNSTKAQPWKALFTEEELKKKPTEDGKNIVACPKMCIYGSNVLG